MKSLPRLNTNEQLTALKMKISAEHPSPKVDTFSAYINVLHEGLEVEAGSNPSVAVDHNNLLIRVRKTLITLTTLTLEYRVLC